MKYKDIFYEIPGSKVIPVSKVVNLGVYVYFVCALVGNQVNHFAVYYFKRSLTFANSTSYFKYKRIL